MSLPFRERGFPEALELEPQGDESGSILTYSRIRRELGLVQRVIHRSGGICLATSPVTTAGFAIGPRPQHTGLKPSHRQAN
jgi:hypothetical protein